MAQEIQDFAEMPAVNQVEWHPYHHDDEVMLGALYAEHRAAEAHHL